MAKAAAAKSTGMTAVLGGTREDVIASIAKHGLTAANENGAGQIVAAGTLEQIEAFQAEPPAGARLRPLAVAGAFHSVHMDPAAKLLGHYAQAISTKDPRLDLLSNVDGKVVSDGREFLRRLVSQTNSPVRWDLCMESMVNMGVTGVLELLPDGTLTGLANRAMKGVEAFALKSPDDIPAALDFVERHGAPSTANSMVSADD